jgi:hypothetical protein
MVSLRWGLRFRALTADMKIVPSALISDWRRAAMKCIEAAGHDEALDQVRSGADHIMAFLHPLILPNRSESELAKLHNDILQLCKKAYDFRMMMRRSQDHYRCYSVPAHARGGGSLFADVACVAGGGTQEMGDRVAFTLFGGLCKLLDTSERIYLEKAQIVMDTR